MSALLPEPPTREELREQLVRTRIAGRVATPRENNLENFERLAARAPYYMFGLEPAGTWTFAEVLALMAKQCGVSADASHREGVDTIDPDRTIDALDAMAARIRRVASVGGRVLFATGHPAGLLPIYLALARDLQARGCPVLTPGAGWSYRSREYWPQTRHIRYVGGVAMVSAGGDLQHTHSPRPMEAILGLLRDAGQAWPQLVIADHGWAGAAGQAGVDTVGFADCNDPALFVGEAEGKVGATVPLDDNVLPHYYTPLSAYLRHHVAQRG